MKVLSLREPFATLIKEKIKKTETRGYKTNYRGELLIHASLTKISKKVTTRGELMSLIEPEKLN
ncbi:MAG: ASCH domain-containing protein, partial [Bacilli bacterium]|nr:ASCH domain-containing protein [Bacilli bacterium]